MTRFTASLGGDLLILSLVALVSAIAGMYGPQIVATVLLFTDFQ